MIDIGFISGFGPVPASAAESFGFWSGRLGIGFEQPAPGYFHTEHLDGARAFAIWPLDQAAEATFGTAEWPAEHPVPQAWIEFDVDSPAGVADAIARLREEGCVILRDAHEEEWGQTTARLQSPEGLLVGIAYTPWMHEEPAADAR